MKRRKVLIISYHSLPLDVVSSYRVKAYCDHFFQYNIVPTLLTHRWELDDRGSWKFHNDDRTIVTESLKSHEIIRLPRTEASASEYSIYSKIRTIIKYARGDLDVELINSYQVFRNFLFTHLQQHQYDLIISVFNPHNHLKLAYEIHKKFDIPYVLDFRDLWDNEVVAPSYDPGFKKRIIDRAIKYWWRKWIKKSLFFTTTGEKWKNYLQELSSKKGFVVRNGFEGKMKEVPVHSTPKFKIVHFGKIYRNQHLELFLEAFSEFIQTKDPNQVKLEFIGLKRDKDFDAMKKVRSFIPTAFLSEVPYKPKKELLQYCKEEACLFCLPNFKEDNGSFFVKLYDYMSLAKPTIICPAIGSDSEYIISYTRTGKVFNSVKPLLEYLNFCYEQYSEKGYVTFDGDRTKINEFRRGKQVEVLASLLHKYL